MRPRATTFQLLTTAFTLAIAACKKEPLPEGASASASLPSCEIRGSTARRKTASAGRRPDGLALSPREDAATIAGHLAEAAEMEAASVFAFERLDAELLALGAPPTLRRRVLETWAALIESPRRTVDRDFDDA